jgi:hypothetical protein
MHTGGDTAAIILYGNGIVFINRNADVFAITGKGFVNGIINYFIHEMMQSFFADIANVHGGAFTNRFQSFQHLNTFRTVTIGYRDNFFFCFSTHK